MSRSNRFRVDVSARSAVWLCEIDGCVRRGVAPARLDALRAARAHELQCHPGSRIVLNLLRQYEARHAVRF